jgi:hypothetical protein
MTSMDHFPTETAGLAAAHRAELAELGDGGRFELRIAPVTKRIGGQPRRTVSHECHVIRTITTVIPSPMSGSAMSSPIATTAALATTARLTYASARA